MSKFRVFFEEEVEADNEDKAVTQICDKFNIDDDLPLSCEKIHPLTTEQMRIRDDIEHLHVFEYDYQVYLVKGGKCLAHSREKLKKYLSRYFLDDREVEGITSVGWIPIKRTERLESALPIDPNSYAIKVCKRNSDNGCDYEIIRFGQDCD